MTRSLVLFLIDIFVHRNLQVPRHSVFKLPANFPEVLSIQGEVFSRKPEIYSGLRDVLDYVCGRLGPVKKMARSTSPTPAAAQEHTACARNEGRKNITAARHSAAASSTGCGMNASSELTKFASGVGAVENGGFRTIA